MNAIGGERANRAVTRGLCLQFCRRFLSLSATASVLLSWLAAAMAEEDQTKEFPGLGEPRIVYSARERRRDGYWTAIAFSPDNNRLVGSLVRHPESKWLDLLTQRVGEVRSFDLVGDDKDAKIVATALNTQFEILAAPSGASREPLLLARWHHTQPKEVVVFEPRDGGPNESLLGRFQSPRAAEINLHTWNHVYVAVSPAADILILGTALQEAPHRKHVRWSGDVKAWDLPKREPLFSDAWDGAKVVAVAFSPDGKFIAAGVNFLRPTTIMGIRESRVVCWPQGFAEKHFELVLPQYGVSSLAFAPDSKTVAVGGTRGVVKWIDVEQGKVRTSLEVLHDPIKRESAVQRLAFSPNGQLLAAGCGNYAPGGQWGETFLIDILKAQVYKVPSSQEGMPITCVAFSPNGKYLAAGGIDGVLKLWQLDGGK